VIAWGLLILCTGAAVVASLDRAARLPTFLLATATLVAISSIRYKTGYDYDTYTLWYQQQVAGEDMSGIEWAWQLVNAMAYTIFRSPQGVFVISSVLIYVPLAWAIYRESRYAAFGLLALVLNVPFYWESLGILRQYAAISFGLAASVMWLQHRRVAFLALVTLGALFHVTALVCLVVPLLARLRSRVLMVGLGAALYWVLNVWLEDLVTSLEVLAKYQAYFDGTIVAEGEVSSGLVIYLRMLVAVAFVVAIERLPDLDQRRKNLMINGLILAYALFFTLYESTALRRVAYYFFVYELLIIAYLAEAALRSRGARSLQWFCAMGLYLTLATVLLAKDVWTNPIGRQQDSDMNYVYRTILQ